jgi:low affinity Fe/Cu permease
MEWLLWYVIDDLIGIFGWNFFFADSGRLKIESVMIFVLILAWVFVQNSHLYRDLFEMEEGSVEKSRKELGKKKEDRNEERGKEEEKGIMGWRTWKRGREGRGNEKRERRKEERSWKSERGVERRETQEEEMKKCTNPVWWFVEHVWPATSAVETVDLELCQSFNFSV